jgi:hypothetical protein
MDICVNLSAMLIECGQQTTGKLKFTTCISFLSKADYGKKE